jgi:hypothetical protein
MVGHTYKHPEVPVVGLPTHSIKPFPGTSSTKKAKGRPRLVPERLTATTMLQLSLVLSLCQIGCRVERRGDVALAADALRCRPWEVRYGNTYRRRCSPISEGKEKQPPDSIHRRLFTAQIACQLLTQARQSGEVHLVLVHNMRMFRPTDSCIGIPCRRELEPVSSR